MKKQNKKGFTLVELVIVIAVIAILAGVLIGTFATVISRANQNKALQEWKAKVDEAYVDYVAEEHIVPGYIVKNASNVTFAKEKGTSGIDLVIDTFKLDNNDPARAVADTKYNTFVVLDKTNGIVFLWNAADSTYSVVAVSQSYSDASLATSYTPHTTETDPDVLVMNSSYKKITQNGVDYYGVE